MANYVYMYVIGDYNFHSYECWLYCFAQSYMSFFFKFYDWVPDHFNSISLSIYIKKIFRFLFIIISFFLLLFSSFFFLFLIINQYFFIHIRKCMQIYLLNINFLTFDMVLLFIIKFCFVYSFFFFFFFFL